MSEHVMIDLETLGTEPNSVILSLGAVKFDRNKIYEDDGLYLQMRWQDQLDSGGIVTEGTIRFWLGQPRAARDVILNKSGLKKPDAALQELNAWFKKHIKRPKDCGVWAKGPGFDLALLGDLYRRQGQGKPPWPYWSERCVRTALMMDAAYKVPRPKEMIEHHAFYDAVYQAMQVRRFLVCCEGPAPKNDDLLT
jgi:DNA polymerase III epsilon subunit-like protein